MGDDIKADGFRERAALADGDDVTDLHLEGRGAVHRDVAMALLVPAVLGNEVKVVPADDDGALHLGGDDEALQHAAADTDVAREGALLVDVVAFDGLLRRLETEADGAVVARGAALGDDALGALEDPVLLLEGLLGLGEQLLRHRAEGR